MRRHLKFCIILKEGFHIKILLTAFAGEKNSSRILIDGVVAENKLILTNSFNSSKKEMLEAIKVIKPDFIIAFGQKPKASCICVETHARKDKVIKTNFDLLSLLNSLNEHNIRFEISDNAGNYLCNHVYYESLKYIKESNLCTKTIFIHLPCKKHFDNFSIVSDWLNEYVKGLL